ncbi:MAG: hypothetical protein M3075_04605 [Candidatus Dormibacteraeota bacterium]|jgi:hypothetical protein|nr:hypothetical protein [Candidatus Dormibacteraeota bacterium]
MQLAVIALTLVGALNLLFLLPYFGDYLRRSIRQSIDLSLASQPGTVENADQVRMIAEQVAFFSVALTVAFAIVWCLLVLIGTLRRWTWLYWLLMIAAGLSVLGLPQQALEIFGVGISGGPGQPVFLLPLPNALLGLILGLAELALFIWMIVALRRFGPWACRKVPVA